MATKRIERKPKRYGVRYPWSVWFDKGTVTLKRGLHFDGKLHGFAITARQAAARHGIRISVSIGEQTVTIRVVE